MPLINAHLYLSTCTDKREDFENFLQSISETDYYKFYSKNFKTKLIDYRKTKEHYEKLKNKFLEKFNNCLDASFLIDKELKMYSQFLDLDFDESDYYVGVFSGIKSFNREGFLWVTTGKTILIEDFFLMKHPIYFSNEFPVNIEDLRQCWDIAYYDLGEAAKGCAEGLYVQFLKEKKMEINNPKFEKGNEPLPETIQTNSKNNLSHKQQILLLEKLGVFEIPEIKKLTGLQIGKLFSYLLNRDEKNTNTYFRNRSLDKKQVSMDKDFVKTDTNVKRVSEILKEIGLEKL